MFSPSNKIHREVGRAKDLSASRYSHCTKAWMTDETFSIPDTDKRLVFSQTPRSLLGSPTFPFSVCIIYFLPTSKVAGA